MGPAVRYKRPGRSEGEVLSSLADGDVEAIGDPIAGLSVGGAVGRAVGCLTVSKIGHLHSRP